MENKKISISSIFNNNKFVLIFSIVAAIIIWIFITVLVGPDERRTFDNIPITIDKGTGESASGFEAYYDQLETVSVVVEGKKYALSSLNSNDIVVTAQAGTVLTSGTKRLTLTARAGGSTSDFNVISVSPSYVDVFFDTPMEIEMEVKPQVLYENSVNVAEGYIKSQEQPSIERVTISGPTTYVSRVEEVVAVCKVADTLRKTETFPATIQALDSYDTIPRYLTITYENENVEPTVTITILKKKTVSIRSEILNMPNFSSDQGVEIVYNPSTIEIAGEETYVDSLEYLSVGSIDFASLKPGLNTFSFDIPSNANYIVTDDNKKLNVSINLEGMTTATFTVNERNISIVNVPDNKNVTLVRRSIPNVTIIGPEDVVSSLTDNDILAVVDLSDQNLSVGEQAVPADIEVNGYANCWAVGDPAEVYIRVSE